MGRLRKRTPAVIIAVIATIAPHWATASDVGRLTLAEENDAFASSDDRHYTQGLRLSYLSGDITSGGFWDRPFEGIAGTLPIFRANPAAGKRKIEWVVLGQSIFTPENLHLSNPDPRDRPYAGWLYTGASLLQESSGYQLENLELLAGVVGPAALGKLAQDDFHRLLQIGESHGWHYQLRNEPGLVLSYERKWRLEQPLVGGLAIDAVPEVGASLGNVFTYGQVGGALRFGQNLQADYGAPHVRPSLSGTWFDGDRMTSPFGWYFFVGAQGRAVGRNIFLDGNTWESSRSVPKKPLVGDLLWGVSAFWSENVRLDFVVTERSKEFYGQHFHDRFGMINLSVRFW